MWGILYRGFIQYQMLLLQVGENQESYDPGRLLSDSWDSTSGDSGIIFDMALSLLHVIIISPEAQRFLVGSLNMQRETESLVSVLVLLAASAGRTEYQANMICYIASFTS